MMVGALNYLNYFATHTHTRAFPYQYTQDFIQGIQYPGMYNDNNDNNWCCSYSTAGFLDLGGWERRWAAFNPCVDLVWAPLALTGAWWKCACTLLTPRISFHGVRNSECIISAVGPTPGSDTLPFETAKATKDPPQPRVITKPHLADGRSREHHENNYYNLLNTTEYVCRKNRKKKETS